MDMNPPNMNADMNANMSGRPDMMYPNLCCCPAYIKGKIALGGQASASASGDAEAEGGAGAGAGGGAGGRARAGAGAEADAAAASSARIEALIKQKIAAHAKLQADLDAMI